MHNQHNADTSDPDAPASNLQRDTNTVAQHYQRRRPPHLDGLHTHQFVTFRLADSLPASKRAELEQALEKLPNKQRESERHKRIEHWLDAGLGSCTLRHATMARTMQQTMGHFDGTRYHLITWCIMPNHVHVLLETLAPLAGIIRSWKMYTARWAHQNAARIGFDIPAPTASGTNAFWMRDYWDRYIRDEKHYNAVRRYIHNNPVKAGLCQHPADWRWSSAHNKNNRTK